MLLNGLIKALHRFFGHISAAFYEIPHETKHMVRQAPAVKIVTKICSFVTFVTIVQGTFLTFSVVRY